MYKKIEKPKTCTQDEDLNLREPIEMPSMEMIEPADEIETEMTKEMIYPVDDKIMQLHQSQINAPLVIDQSSDQFQGNYIGEPAAATMNEKQNCQNINFRQQYCWNTYPNEGSINLGDFFSQGLIDMTFLKN